MTAQEKIAVIQAQEDGKELQFRVRRGSSREAINSEIYGYEWRDYEDSEWYFVNGRRYVFNFDAYEYRVKPEPREFWIMDGRAFATRHSAEWENGFYMSPRPIIHVKEVTKGN